jgi:ribonuclease HI|tara:strand:+ start:98 stop:571 length:474 start_codon:yes stop_codon:yes gene_type:complete
VKVEAGNAEEIRIFTDGACRGNPGIGGWGVLIIRGSSQTELLGVESATTNNRMELKAAIEGLQAVGPSQPVAVYTDSQYVRNGITDWMTKWKQNGWRTASRKAVKNQDLWEALDNARQARSVSWHWVRGHSGHPQNERADALANRAIDDYLNDGERN